MAWSPSAIYRVSHLRGWRVEDLRISDVVMEKARKGQENYRQKICMAFRERVKKDTGRDPGWVNYDDLVIKKERDVPAPAKKSTPRAAKVLKKGFVTDAQRASEAGRKGGWPTLAIKVDDPHDDVGEGGCGCECKACDDNIRHCGNRSRGCKH